MKDYGTRLQQAYDSLSLTEFPVQVVLETIARCNLRCPACPSHLLNRKRGKLPYPLFQQVVDEIARENPETELYPAYMGEPLLYEPLFDGIAYAKKQGLHRVFLNSNGLLLDERRRGLLLDSGVDRVILSIDGTSPETYEPRRRGGDFATARDHALALLREARGHGGDTEVWVQMIVDAGNRHQETEFRDFWLSHGAVVKIRPQLTWGGRVGKNELAEVQVDRGPCPWLMRQVVITVDGEAALCDADHEALCNLGNIHRQSIREIWNSTYLAIRKQHQAGDFSHPLCAACDDWKVGVSEVFRP